MILEEIVLGYPIRAQITTLDDGLHVLLIGGCRSHIGSISLIQFGKISQTLTVPGHREHTVSEHWASVLSERCKCTVAVACGIHYDSLSRAELGEILRTLEKMLIHICTQYSINQ